MLHNVSMNKTDAGYTVKFVIPVPEELRIFTYPRRVTYYYTELGRGAYAYVFSLGSYSTGTEISNTRIKISFKEVLQNNGVFHKTYKTKIAANKLYKKLLFIQNDPHLAEYMLHAYPSLAALVTIDEFFGE